MQIKSKRVAIAVAVSGACLAAVTLAPTASSAATGYTVSKGGAVKTANSGTYAFIVPGDTAATLTCKTFAAPGTAVKGSHKFAPKTYKSASGLSAAGILSPTKASLKGCANPTAGNTTVTPSGKWDLGFVSKSKTGGSGYLYNVSTSLTAAGGICTFTAKGAVYGTYSNSTGIFTGTKTPGLVLSKVANGCGLVNLKSGQKAYLKGEIKITPKITIK